MSRSSAGPNRLSKLLEFQVVLSRFHQLEKVAKKTPVDERLEAFIHYFLVQ